MIEQRSNGWFQARLGKATASKFNVIMGNPNLAPYKNYQTQLVLERLTGQPTESYTTSAMQWGVDMEDAAVEAYEAATGNETTKAPFIEHPILLAGASPDRYIGDDGILETKCPNTATHIMYLNFKRLPALYKPQVQGQLWISERKWAHFVSFDPRLPENAQLLIVRVDRDEEYINKLEERVTQFLVEVEEMYEKVKEYKNEQIN